MLYILSLCFGSQLNLKCVRATILIQIRTPQNIRTIFNLSSWSVFHFNDIIMQPVSLSSCLALLNDVKTSMFLESE